MESTQKLNPSKFESKWQKVWEKNRIYQPDLRNSKKPFYNLMMFPYPSAEGLHVGNMYAFTGADIYGRFMRMQGYDVFEPIGLDGFGIHSENYAIKIGKHPVEQAKVSQKHFYEQLHAIGNGFAWENTLETYDPEYYRWTQWLFVQMFKRGLAYRRKSPVNYCPSCKTVLSDEQVIDGKCERCKSVVEKREMEQWFFKITEYADRLLKNLDTLDWAEKVVVAQRNWIGKKTGIRIKYQISGIKYEVECFTTRPDTNFGATFIVIAPEHKLAQELVISNSQFSISNEKRKEIEEYVERSKKKSDADRIEEGREKTGVFTGFYAVNPLTGYKMPIWISDFVLSNFGTGAVVGVPGHDLRDFEFATKYKIPIIRVVVGKDGDRSAITQKEQVQEDEGVMINSGFLDGLNVQAAMEKIMDYLEEKGWGKRETTFRLRDWCISRQRYWGAPIPMIYCESCAKKNIGWGMESGIKNQELGIKNNENIKIPNSKFIIHNSNSMSGWFPVPEADLPVLLPYVEDYRPTGSGASPLAQKKDWVQVPCPHCHKLARRETDVSDTFLDSAWYFLRYPSIENPKHQTQNSNTKNSPSENGNRESEIPWNPEITKKWLPVNIYIGGAEHSVLHLLYSRFVTMTLCDMGLLHFEEPFSKFYAHGLIISEGAKMSKSKGNIVNPDEYIKKYGADTLRTYLMFLGPFDMGGDFRDTGTAGIFRFLGRVYRLAESVLTSADYNARKDPQIEKMVHRTVKSVTEDLKNLRYNTAIAHIMELTNVILDNPKSVSIQEIQVLTRLLAPFAPFMTEELWSKIRQKNPENGKNESPLPESVHCATWPSYDEAKMVETTATVVIQVNGKLRDALSVSISEAKNKEFIEKKARESAKITAYLASGTVRKVIFVPGKLINFVVN